VIGFGLGVWIGLNFGLEVLFALVLVAVDLDFGWEDALGLGF